LLQELEIPLPKIDTAAIMQGWDLSDSTYYSESDIEKCYNLIRTPKVTSLLKSLRTKSIWNLSNANNRYGDGISIIRLIKNYSPEVRLLLLDVGIIGTAINGYDNVGAKSTPMSLTNVQKSVWEIDLYLKKGTVKFRCRDSWAQNWGAGYENEVFPKGAAYREGNDIPIDIAGNYHIILDLSENTYEFIKQDN
jgi:hypothetical protein